MVRIFIFFIPIVFTTFLNGKTIDIDTIRTHILQDTQKHLKGPDRSTVEKLYSLSGYQPIWITNQERISTLIRSLFNPVFNYKNKTFETKVLRTLLYRIDQESFSHRQLEKMYARLDIALTTAYVRLVRFIVQGDVDWILVQKKLKELENTDDIKARWQMSIRPLPSAETLLVAAQEGDLENFLHYLIPLERRYYDLIKMLQRYKQFPKFPKVPYGTKVLKPGDRSARIAIIKKRLQITGDYPLDAPIDNRFDTPLYRAILQFQARHLIKQDGYIDKVTTYYLNITKEDLIRSIIVNLDKTKLYPKTFGDEFIEVNIPEFTLRYFKNKQEKLAMNVVVGRIDRPTPLFAQKMKYFVINPTWTIPKNLVRRDLIPVLQKNPFYLEEHNIKVYKGAQEITDFDLDAFLAQTAKKDAPIPFRFVQQPGEKNALGRIKFMFPNQYAVYLHDTDNKSLFKRRYRVYSSGCVRVEKPFVLLKHLMDRSEKTLTDQEIHDLLQTKKPTTIRLKHPLPVHFVYFTAFRKNGLDYFRNDIYAYDKIILESTEGNKKPTFKLPKDRLISVQKQRNYRLSN